MKFDTKYFLETVTAMLFCLVFTTPAVWLLSDDWRAWQGYAFLAGALVAVSLTSTILMLKSALRHKSDEAACNYRMAEELDDERQRLLNIINERRHVNGQLPERSKSFARILLENLLKDDGSVPHGRKVD